MKIKIITIGTPQLSFAKDGINEYKKRLSRFTDIELIHIKENKNADQKVLSLIKGYECLLLDESGKQYSTLELSQKLESYKNRSQNIAIIVGSPNGHTETIRSKNYKKISLSRLTFPHDIATMIIMETLYRSLSILSGHPYHRE